ncbi:MAG: valine--tRNA ligase [bacterium]
MANFKEPNIDAKFLKPYDSAGTEEANYSAWEKSGYFNPDISVRKGVTKPDAKAFSIVLPPPNVTGTLHIGHAAMLAIEDIMVRFARMRGMKTLWLPGTDHAAIATQSKVEDIIYKEEKKRRHEIGREELLRRVNEFASKSHDTIVSQTKKMGASIDWSREAFTLDEKRNFAVRTAFKQMYDDGLIFKGHRIINWDPKGQTTISDDEIVYKEEKVKFYYFKYGPFIIGTSRPETKFGDRYVVMHPDDGRYADFKHGQKIDLEWINGPISATVIKDKSIDMAFGTGVMTITPWHSNVDFEIAERYKLDKEQIIDKTGRLLPIAGEFAGQKITEARAKIVEKLKAKGLLEKEEDYTHQIATAERTGGIIEPQIMNQWFIAVNKTFKAKNSKLKGIKKGQEVTLKELMLTVVKNGQTKILPDHFEKVYFNWIENLHDWCISRQIWYGHRIPVWYKKSEKSGEKGGDYVSETYCGVDAPTGDGWTQDEDTLDTWFSSGLWTFSTLGWPDAWDAVTGEAKKGSDLAVFHPTSILETGYDILFFWVARMILMSTYLLGDIPFETVYLHGLVRDGQGRKMSKSLGNIIDPVDLINKYGADAVRLSLIIGTSPGNDLKLSEDKVKGYKHFANKIWNISRFVLSYAGDVPYEENFAKYSEADMKLNEERSALIEEITKEMEEYKFYIVGEKVYQYIWRRFADQILEESRPVLEKGTPEEILSRKQFLQHTLVKMLLVLHPFMPFVTEEIWKSMPVGNKKDFLMLENWPL